MDCLPLQIIDKTYSFDVTSTEVFFQVPDLFTVLKLSWYILNHRKHRDIQHFRGILAKLVRKKTISALICITSCIKLSAFHIKFLSSLVW